jgi:hypothetical protein
MKSELVNLSLFAYAIGKTLLNTGLGFSIFFAYALERWARVPRVPAPSQQRVVARVGNANSRRAA